MNREFLVNMFILLTINLLVKPIYIFFIEAGVQNATGPETYGLYFIVYDFAFLFLFLNDAGLQNYNTTVLTRMQGNKDAYLSKIISLKFGLGFFFIVIVTLSSWYYGYSDSFPRLPFYIGLAFFVSSLFVLMRTTLSAMGHYRADSWLSSIEKITLIFVIGFLLYRHRSGHAFEITWYPLSQSIIGILACLMLYLTMKKKGIVLKWDFDIKWVKPTLLAMLPFAGILLFNGALNRIDAVMIDQLMPQGGHREAGLYAAAFRFVDAGNMIGYLFAGIFLPMIARQVDDRQASAMLFGFAFKLLFILSIMGSILCMVMSKELFFSLYSTEYHNSHFLLKIMMASFVAVSLTHIFGSYLLANGFIQQLNWIFMIGLAINMGINYYAIPKYGAQGAAYATIFTQFTIYVSMLYLLHIKKPFIASVRLSLVALAIGIVLVGLYFGMDFIKLEKWLIAIFLMILVPAIVFASGWLNVKEILVLRPQKE